MNNAHTIGTMISYQSHKFAKRRFILTYRIFGINLSLREV